MIFGIYDVDDLFAFGPYRVAIIAYSMFLRLWYFLAIGIVIGATFNTFIPAAKMKRLFVNAHSIRAIFIAAILGVVSPLGSYAVIPVFTTFLGLGIPLAPVMTFLTASPLINPFIFTITAQLLGFKMAFARTISAIVAGILMGLVFKYLERFKPFQSSLASAHELTSSFKVPFTHQNPNSLHVQDDKSKMVLTMLGENRLPHSHNLRMFFIQCVKMIRHPGKWFAFAIILAAVVDVYVPTDWIVRSLGGHSYSLLLAAAMAIPFYVCGGGAVPLVWELMRTGMDQGAALTFFIAGPVTRIAPMLTVIALLRYRAFVVYILVSFTVALVLGVLYHFA